MVVLNLVYIKKTNLAYYVGIKKKLVANKTFYFYPATSDRFTTLVELKYYQYMQSQITPKNCNIKKYI